MAVKSYQAQGEGEISLSKGEKIKGDRELMAEWPPDRKTSVGAGSWA